MKHLSTTFVLALLALFVGKGPTCFAKEPNEWVKANMKPLAKLYLHLHKNPELSFEEEETAQRIAKEIADVGATITAGVGGFGFVGIIENGEGPTVMLRADMEGLPVTEQTNQPYASKKVVTDADGKKVGVMHACGHDIHMTTLVGTAR